jgi:hypothetical protein
MVRTAHLQAAATIRWAQFGLIRLDLSRVYETANFAQAMVGVFLEDSLPILAPPPLTFFRGTPAGDGQIDTSFRTLKPLIGQVFFIGDGLTGTGAGARQIFEVPPTATQLYLGYIDSCAQPGPPGGTPGCYSDNAGVMTAVFGIYSVE